MTPLGHTAVSFLVGAGLTKILPGIDQKSLLIGITLGGTVPDLDLIYRFYQKGPRVFDGTIGKHRFFPTHTPLFTLLISFFICIFNVSFGIAFFIGTLVHFFLDTLFFPEGVNFTYPFGKKMTAIFTVKFPSFWAPRRISQINGWWKNYLKSPLFWIFEAVPFFIALVVLLQLISR